MRWGSAVVAATVVFLLAFSTSQAEISFLTRADSSVGAAPTAFALSSNGEQLVVASDEGLSVYRPQQGRLVLSERLSGVSFVKSLAVADLNADGFADIACTDGRDSVLYIFYGRAGGGFTAPAKVDVPSPVRLLTVARAQRASAASLVLIHDDRITLLAREDGAHFASTTLAEAPMVDDLTLSDVDDDGSLDLVLVDEERSRLLLATRKQDNNAAEVRTVLQPSYVVAADVDGDGRDELLVVGVDGLALHRRTGVMKFDQAEWIWKTPQLTHVAVGDVDGDGHADLMVSNRTRGTVTVLRGKGDGTFTRSESYAVGRAPESVLLADVTRDGIADALTLNHLDHSITVLPGRKDGSFDGTPAVVTDSDDIAAIAVADFNVDGRPDLAVTSETRGTLTILLGDGRGQFIQTWSQPIGRRPRALVAGNFDGDGFPDVAVANFESDDIAILLGNGRGGFEGPTLIPVGSGPSTIVTGSFQGDHHLDLAVANTLSDSASVLFNDGRGRFRDVLSYAVGPRPTYLMVGDLNHDGHPDLVAGSAYSETVTVLYGDGQTLGNAQRNQLAGTARPLVSDDFDRDGHLDLVTTNAANNSVDILPGVASGSFGTPLQFPVGNHPDAVANGDFNGDGRPDLAIVHHETGTITILLNTTRPGTGAASPSSARRHHP